MSLKMSLIRVCSVGMLCMLVSPVSADIEYSAGHGDIGLAFDVGSGELDLHYHFGTDAVLDGVSGNDVEVNPSGAFVRVADSAMLAAQSFHSPILGVNAGDDIWVLPQSNTGPTGAFALGVPFLGWATEELSNDFTSTTFEMTGFSGPGDFAVFQFAGFPPDIIMQTSDGVIGGPDDTWDFLVGGHDHANFGFTQAGVYDITLTATAFSDALFGPGGSVSDTETFRFVVGDLTAIPEPGSLAALACLGTVGMLVRRRRKPKAAQRV